MFEITAENAEDYLRRAGHIPPRVPVTVERLLGGVSNEVLYVALPEGAGPDFVLKQVRRQLRVPQPWFSRLERIWREVEVLRVCEELLAGEPPGRRRACTPRILFEDRENYAFAMTAAPRSHAVWKRQLLAGQVDPSIARACGTLLARLHAGTWHDPAVRRRLEDREIFDELRIDPYYRTVAGVHADLRPALDRLIASVWANRHALVHADFSPKNLLVYDDGLMMVDFETGHFGDPAFDLGFFLSHLMLKAHEHPGGHERYLDLTAAFWEAYRPDVERAAEEPAYGELVARGIQNFAGCALARLDGKSRIDYLEDETRREAVRDLCRWIFAESPGDWSDVLARARASLEALAGIPTTRQETPR